MRCSECHRAVLPGSSLAKLLFDDGAARSEFMGSPGGQAPAAHSGHLTGISRSGGRSVPPVPDPRASP